MSYRDTSRRKFDRINLRQKMILKDILENKASRDASIRAYGPGSVERIINGDVGLIRADRGKR